MRRIIVTAMMAVAATLPAASTSMAQIKIPPETHNAALRYWMALVDLQDASPDVAAEELLESTAAGKSSWDEAKLGPIIDRNMQAIQEMQRATKLPECDWGIEYSRGARASVNYLVRARELARLNTFYGMRLMAKGRTQEAVDTWLAGVRFSQHLAHDGPVLLELVARAAIVSDFQAMTSAAQGGRLETVQKMQITTAIRSLPADVFDWGEALGLEEAAYEFFVQQMRQSKDPAAFYRDLSDAPLPKNFALPPDKDVAAFRSLIIEAQDALRLPPEEARPRLEQLQVRIGKLSESFELAVPSLVKINDARAEVEASCAKLLQAVAGS